MKKQYLDKILIGCISFIFIAIAAIFYLSNKENENFKETNQWLNQYENTITFTHQISEKSHRVKPLYYLLNWAKTDTEILYYSKKIDSSILQLSEQNNTFFNTTSKYENLKKKIEQNTLMLVSLKDSILALGQNSFKNKLAESPLKIQVIETVFDNIFSTIEQLQLSENHLLKDNEYIYIVHEEKLKRYHNTISIITILLVFVSIFLLFIYLMFRKKSNEAVDEQIQKISAFFNSSSDILLLIKEDGTINSLNKSAVTFINSFEAQEIIVGKNVFSLLSPTNKAIIEPLFESAKNGVNTNTEIELIKNNCSNWYKIQFTFIHSTGNIKSNDFIVNLSDINEQKKSSIKLSVSEENYRTLIRNLKAGIIIYDAENKIKYCNFEAEKILNIKSAEVTGKKTENLENILYDEYGQLLSTSNYPEYIVSQSRKPINNVVLGNNIQNKQNGNWILVNAYPNFNSDFSIRETIVTFTDITQQKSLIDAQKESSDFLSAVFKGSPVGICIISTTGGKIFDVNDVFLKYCGYTKEEVIGSTTLDLNFYDNLQDRDKLLSAVKEKGNVHGMDIVFNTKSGQKMHALVSTSLIKIKGVKYLFTFLIDITSRKKIEKQMKESEQKFYTIFHNSPVALTLTTTEGEIIDINDAFCQASGYTREEAIGSNTVDLNVYQKIDERTALYNDVEKEGYAIKRELGFKNKAGEQLYGLVSTSKIIIGNQHILLSYIVDITERIHAEQLVLKNEKTIRDLANNVPGVVFRLKIGKNGNVYFSYLSEKIFDLYGFKLTPTSTKEQIALHIPEEEQPRFFESISAAIKERKPWELESRIICGDGSIKWVLAKAVPAIFEDELIFSGILIDINDRKKIEEELVHLYNKLNEKATALEESNKELERFAYIASHDLQEPLRMVNSFLKLLSNRYEGKLDETADQYIHFAVDGSMRMKQLIDDLLLYSRIGTNKDTYTETDLNEVFAQVLQIYNKPIQEKHAQITSTNLPSVLANSVQMMQLFQNLIGNAIKYSGTKEPCIHLNCTIVGKFYQFSLADNGIGIDPKYFDKIFEVFQRAHNGNSKYKGTGIGLSICKKIIEKHGGNIWVDAVLDEGATFYFTLPIPHLIN